jgi:hypothetical protein
MSLASRFTSSLAAAVIGSTIAAGVSAILILLAHTVSSDLVSFQTSSAARNYYQNVPNAYMLFLLTPAVGLANGAAFLVASFFALSPEGLIKRTLILALASSVASLLSWIVVLSFRPPDKVVFAILQFTGAVAVIIVALATRRSASRGRAAF